MGVKLRWQQWLGQGHFGNKPDGSAMNTSPSPVEVAILAFPDTTASVTFGMYDLFMAAGRDWSIALGGQAGPQLMRPYIISASTNPFTAANGVMIAPHAALEDRPASGRSARRAGTSASRWRPAPSSAPRTAAAPA